MARTRKAGDIIVQQVQQSISDKLYIGIDNGVSGSVGAVGNRIETQMFAIPTFMQQNYTKEKKNITRIDTPSMNRILRRLMRQQGNSNVLAVMERPMVNPGRFAATQSALRALEATLIVLENLKIPYMYVDSRQWQDGLLPSFGKKKIDSTVLKLESRDIGLRLFPTAQDEIKKQKDADGLLIAEWARRSNL